MAALAAAGGLDPIADETAIRSAALPAAVEAASVGNTLYAYPLTADNGYFLYYNKAYFTDEDVESLERMLERGCRLGGEQSGHTIFTDYATTGDGQLTALQFLQILKRSGKPASELASICPSSFLLCSIT